MRQRVLTDNAKRYFFQKRMRRLRVAVIILLIVVIVLVGAFCPYEKLLPAYNIPARLAGELRVHFLSVGEGDCTVVEFPDGAIVVIDAGGGGFYHTAAAVRYIKGLAARSVSYVVTHADSDHYGGMLKLISSCGADALYLPVLDGESAYYKKLLSFAANASIPVKRLSRYATFLNASGAYMVCLSPYSAGETDENDSSAVLYLAYGGVRFLFCADITAVRERRLLRDYALDRHIFDSGDCSVRLEGIDFLKVSHHGSAYSSCEEWLSLLSPANAVITSGAGNRYHHPALQAAVRLAAAGARVFRTDELGSFAVSVIDGAYSVNTDRRS